MVMIEFESEDDEEEELRVETKRTTNNMQIETGVMIRTSSSPNVSIMLEGLSILSMVRNLMRNKKFRDLGCVWAEGIEVGD